MLFSSEKETTMSFASPAAGHARPVSVVPHRAVEAGRGAWSDEAAVPCPRCGELVALPSWAGDGDLTECCGLLLRITCDEHGCQLEQI